MLSGGSAHIAANLARHVHPVSADALAVRLLTAPAIVLLMAVELALAVAGRAIP
jgi:hypothetical protein